MIAIIFYPLGLNPFIQCPMSDLYNRYIDIEDLEDIELNHLKNPFPAKETFKLVFSLSNFFS